jgi:20S proteasome alpha/beta subunit
VYLYHIFVYPWEISAVIGIKCKDGTVVGVEKLVESKLLMDTSNGRVFSLDHHAGLVSVSASDACILVLHSRNYFVRLYEDASLLKLRFP